MVIKFDVHFAIIVNKNIYQDLREVRFILITSSLTLRMIEMSNNRVNNLIDYRPVQEDHLTQKRPIQYINQI